MAQAVIEVQEMHESVGTQCEEHGHHCMVKGIMWVIFVAWEGERDFEIVAWRIQVRRPAGVEPARVEATSSSDCAAAAALARCFKYSAFSRGPISSAAATSARAASACS